MTDISYAWQRLWVPGTSAANLLAQATYFIPQAGAAPLETWQAAICLILLGEPGMGKSAEWQHQASLTENSSFLNLGDFSSGKQIRKALRKLPAVKRWLRQPGTDLWLWLDSYDEALLHEAKLAQALLRQLNEWPTTGLHLRILSRTATWPDYATKELSKHFGREQAVTLLQLAPLTQEQVRQAAEAHEINADAFEAAVARAEAVALATRPVTLRLLLKLWLAGEFNVAAGRGIELLERGCRLLCAEGWDSRRTTNKQADPERRFRLAAQLALLTVGSGRPVLTYDEADDGRQRLRLRDVTDEPLLFTDKQSPVPDRNAVLELVEHSGLFVPAGSEVRWTHPVFADYLAAWALHQARIPLAQLHNLLRAEVPEAGLVPALRDMGVWLASLSPDFAADLLLVDPLTAVRADVLMANDSQRALLVDQLLVLTTTRHFYPQRAETYLGRLAHPGLGTQLEAVLCNAASPPEAHWLAHQLAVSCSVRSLVPLLLKQALDDALPLRRRLEALQSLRSLASAEECHALRPLLTAIPTDDEDDEFRGALLQMLWPHDLSIKELLPLLTPRRNDSLFGNYYAFIEATYSSGLRDGLTAAHLPVLLRWVVRHKLTGYGVDRWVVDSLRTTALAVAWQHTTDPAVLPWLALALRRALLRGEVKQLPTEAAPRQRVLACWVRRRQLPDSWDLFHRYSVPYSHTEPQAPQYQSLVDEADFNFIIAQLRATQDTSTIARLYAAANELLSNAFTAGASDFQDKFSTLYAVMQELRLEPDSSWLVHSDSPQVQRFREGQQTQQRRQREKRRKALLARRWSARTPRLLIRLTDPNRPNPARSWFNAWWLLVRSSDSKPIPLQTEVNQTVGWLRVSLSLKARILALVWRVVQRAPPPAWPDQRYNSFSKGQAAPLAALVLCQDERPQDVASLSVVEWQPWLRAALFGWIGAERRMELFGVARQHHRRAVLRLLANLTDYWTQLAADSHGYLHLNELLREVPDEALWWGVLRSVRRGQWSRHFSQEVLDQLLQLGFRPAELFRASLLTPSPSASSWSLLTLGAFRSALLSTRPASDWWQGWHALLQLGLETANAMLRRLHSRPRWTNLFPVTLTDEQLDELLHWTVRELGVVEENEPDDWEAGVDRGVLRNFRNSLVKALTERATPAAWDSLRKLADELNFPRWITYYLDEARETYCRRYWLAPAPGQLLSFLRQAAQRWPHSSADVLDLILESLDRLQARLQGEPVRAQALWYPVDQQSGYRIVRGNKVVIENEVTDAVKAFLDDDLAHHLFSTQREVQLRATASAQQGQELDLYVQAIPLDTQGQNRTGERLLVFIEAKHQDNKEVATALQEQLVNRYLRQHEAHTGLFLVYWHKPQATKDLLALRQQLVEQAEQASSNRMLIKSYVLDIRLPDDQ